MYRLFTLVSLSILCLIFTGVRAQNVALDFDGADDYVQTSYAGISGTAARTIEAWIKTTANTDPNKGGKQNVVADYGTSATGGRFTLNLLNNYAPRIEIQGSGLPGTVAVNDGKWHHIAVVYNPSASLQYILYVDGKQDTAGNISTSINTGNVNNFMIGRRIDNVNYFNGSIDEVRFYNVALSDSQIYANYKREFCKTPSSLVAYYKFNEGNAGTNNSGKTQAADYSGNANHGVLNNFNLYGSSSNWVNGPALTGGGSSSQIQVFSCNAYKSPSGKYQWSFSGSYKDTLKNFSGCDSIISIQLTIGRSYTTNNVIACDSFISPKGKIYFKGGTYVDSLLSSLGCDSIIRSEVTLNFNKYDTVKVHACDSFEINKTQKVYASGTYKDKLKTINGCDSLVTYQVEISHPAITFDTLFYCDSFFYDQKSIFETTRFVEHYKTIKNCDSTVYKLIVVYPSQKSVFSYQGCDTIFWRSIFLTTDTTILENLKTYHGCDSAITHHFSVNHSKKVARSLTACRYVVINNVKYTNDQILTLYSKTAAGCDSAEVWNIQIINIDTTVTLAKDTLWASANNDSYQWINCTTNGVINGANKRYYAFTSSGNYASIITKGNCADTSICVPVSVGYSSNILVKGIGMYPNPAYSKVTIVSDDDGIELIEIFDLNGKIVKSEKLGKLTFEYSLSGLPIGIYTINIATTKGRYHKKLIILE